MISIDQRAQDADHPRADVRALGDGGLRRVGGRAQREHREHGGEQRTDRHGRTAPGDPLAEPGERAVCEECDHDRDHRKERGGEQRAEVERLVVELLEHDVEAGRSSEAGRADDHGDHLRSTEHPREAHERRHVRDHPGEAAEPAVEREGADRDDR